MFRKLFATVPKYAFAALILLVGIGSLAFWLLKKKVEVPTAAPGPVVVEKTFDNSAKIARIESGFGSLVLADNDLYDVESGELLFPKWLKRGMPHKLFWEAATKTLIAQYERGFVRYKPDGSVSAELPNVPAATVADDYKWAVSSKGGDIHQAEIDWPAMKLVNERKVTSTGLFNDQNFAGNILIGTDRTLLVRNANQLLRVSLETGEHQPIRLPLENLRKRRSPDQKSVVGIQSGEFYCYVVDSDTAKSIKVGRVSFNDCQWLQNDLCAVLGGGRAVVLYDAKKHTLSEVVTLPQFCNRIGDPSPDGRFLFCGAQGKVLLVDVRGKTAAPVARGDGIRWIGNDTYVLSRNVADSESRGIWLQKVGGTERRISAEPYIVSQSGPMLMERQAAGLLVFASRNGLSKMTADGTDLGEVAKLPKAVSHALGIEPWPR